MTYTKKKTLTGVLLALLFLAPALSSAGIVDVSQDYSLRKGDVVKDDLYAIGNNTTVSGSILGDLLAIGTSVFVGGGNSVSDDALIVGVDVNVVSTIKQDLRIVGWSTFFSGTVGKDMAVVSNNVRLLPASTVMGDFLSASGRVVLDGEVKRNVKIVAGEVELNDKVGGNVDITADHVVLGPNALITGNLVYSSSNPATVQEGAKVLGETQYKKIETSSRAQKILPTLWGTWMLINLIVLLLSALILHGVLRDVSVRFVTTAIKHFGWSFVRGFLLFVAAPVAILLSFLTFVGIPFGILGIALYVVFLIIATVYAPIMIGSIIYRLTVKQEAITVNWKTILLGVAVVAAASYVPYLGTVLKFVFILVSLGSVYQVLFDKFREVR